MIELADPPSPPRRKRNATATRARILDAAQRAFSNTGYSHTGIREIARLADTSSTLVLRYFGSKANLFDAALREAMSPIMAMTLPREVFGKTLGDALLDRENAIRPPLMIALASGDPEAAVVAAAVTEQDSIAPFAKWLGPPDAEARALQIAMLATGFVFYLRQLPLQHISASDREYVIGWFARTIQSIVDRKDGGDEDGGRD